MTVASHGRPAVTHYRTLALAGGVSLVELGLETGRTHQIRVHLKHLGHPLLGDPVYGAARWKELPRPRRGVARDFPRPALHAWRIALVHPVTERPLEVESPPARDLAALWSALSDVPLDRLLAQPG